MTIDQLTEAICTHAVQRQILGRYTGQFALAVSREHDHLCIHVRIQGSDTSEIASIVVIGTETVSIRVTPGYDPPQPLITD